MKTLQRVTGVLFGTLGLLFAAAACSSNPNSEDFMKKFADAYCGRFRDCNPTRYYSASVGETKCREEFTGRARKDELVACDEETANGCYADVAALSCDNFVELTSEQKNALGMTTAERQAGNLNVVALAVGRCKGC